MSCKDKEKFLTAEASSKSRMRTIGAIDEYLNILDLSLFRKTNRKWSDDAKERFSIQDMLFSEDLGKAVPNTNAFRQIDRVKGIFYQEETLPSSVSSETTLSKVREVIKKMGVSLQSLSDYLKGNPNVEAKGVNALTDLFRGIIAVAGGKEEIALTEEMVHVATSIIEQKNPAIVSEMISKIDRFSIYKRVLNEYKNDINYQTSDGKPNIRKIKKEAVDKLITELIIKGNEGNTEFPELLEETNKSQIRVWWQKILDWFRGQYKKANIDIFQETAERILEGNEIIEGFKGEGIYLQKKAEEFTANEIIESFKSKNNKNERKFNRPTNLPESFRVLQRTGVNQYSPLLSTEKNKLGDIREVSGRRQSEGISYYTGILGRTFKELLSSSKRGTLMEGTIQRYANLRVVQSISENPLLRQLVGKLGLEEIRIVNSKDIGRQEPLFVYKGIIYINEDKWAENLQEKFNSSVNLDEYIDVSIFEELIHIVANKLYNKEQFLEAEKELTESDRLLVDKFYSDSPSPFDLHPFNRINELIRMKVQKDLVGKSTEDIANQSIIDGIVHKIWDFIMGLFKDSLIKSNKITEDVKQFILDKEERLTGISKEGVLGLPQISTAQKKIQNIILETQERIKNVPSGETTDPILADTDEASNWYERLLDDGTWKRVKNRVTDRVKEFYKKTFPNKKFTKEEKALNEIKRDAGVRFHIYLNLIHKRYFNPDGTKRDKIGDRPFIKEGPDSDVYDRLEKYFLALMSKSFDGGKSPLVFSEVKVYDELKDEAGTIDLLMVDESGKGHILDWKFMNVAPGANDVAWFKKGAYNIQLGRYKEMLKLQYGVKEFGMIRAIPILMKMEREERKKDSPLFISGINIGSVNPENIESLTLLPVPEKSESIASVLEDERYEHLDRLVKKLNSVIEQIGTTAAVGDEEKQYKARRLNILNQAVRIMQVQYDMAPLIDVIKEIRKEGDIIINKYNINFKDKPINSPDLTDEEKSKMSADMREYLAIAKVFSNITVSVGDLLYNEDMKKDVKTAEEKEELKEREKALSEIRNEQDKINRSIDKIGELSGEFANKYIGFANRVIDLLLPEKVVKGLAATFKGISDLPTAALKILYTLTTNAKMTASRVAFDEVSKLMEIRDKLKAKGDLKDIVKQLYQKDEKGSIINKLIYRYSKEFFTEVDNNALEGNRSKKWIKENIDYEEYKKEVEGLLDKRISWIIKKYSTPAEAITEKSIQRKIDTDGELSDSEKLINKLITDERRTFDIDRKDFYGWNNYIIKRHPLKKWLSEEYKQIEKDSDLHELYEFIVKINDHAKEVGYLDNKNKSSFFLPFIRKTMAESLTWDFDVSVVKNWGESFSINPATVGYGKVNELTQQIEHSIPKYYTYDFTVKDGKRDISDLSEDLFKNMISYITHLQKYTYLSKVEDQIKLVRDIEAAKSHLVTTKANELAIEQGEPLIEAGNEENADLFDKFMRGVFYEEKYPVSDTDVAVNAGVTKYMAKAVNRIAGKEVWHTNEEPSAISMVKTIDAANRAFQLKTLGFELISGMVNAFGGRIQMAAQAGNYFKSSEIDKNAGKLLANKFKNEDEREIFVQLMNKFMPMKDDPSYEELKKAGISTFTRGSFSDFLMMFMRKPEQLLEKSVFLSLLDNMMIKDGKIVSIPEYVRSKYKGKEDKGVYYVEAKSDIKREIEELKKSSSISSTMTLVDGELSIPGMDLSDHEQLNRLTRLTRRISRKATGGVSDSDRNQASMSIWLNSMMVFKSWIPKLLATRFDHFQEVSDDFSVIIGEDGTTEGEKYDIGRVRLWWGFMGFNLIKSTRDIINVLYANEQGLEKIDELYIKYAKQYKLRTGKEMKMSREDFIDMIRTNLRNQMRELGMLLSLTGAGLAMGFMQPPEDADKATKNFYRYSQRVIDKFTQELSFFYNPVEFQKLLSGGTFPVIGLATDIERFFQHFFMETTGLDFSNPELSPEEVYKKAQPMKHFGRIFPISKSVFTYGAIFNSDFAKEYDITVPKEAKR